MLWHLLRIAESGHAVPRKIETGELVTLPIIADILGNDALYNYIHFNCSNLTSSQRNASSWKEPYDNGFI